jgi:hypothetical protein
VRCDCLGSSVPRAEGWRCGPKGTGARSNIVPRTGRVPGMSRRLPRGERGCQRGGNFDTIGDVRRIRPRDGGGWRWWPSKARSPALSSCVSAWTRRQLYTTGFVKRAKKYWQRRGLLAWPAAAGFSSPTTRSGPRILYPSEGRALPALCHESPCSSVQLSSRLALDEIPAGQYQTNARILLVILFLRDTAAVTALDSSDFWAFNEGMSEA